MDREEFFPVLEQPFVKHYAFIYHDKDIEDGKLVPPHYHILLMLRNNKSISAVRRMFPTRQNTLASILKDKSGAFIYLTHGDNPEKYQYNPDDIVCDNWQYWSSLDKDGENPNEKTLNILDDMARKIPLYELARRYGREIVINYDKYFLFLELCKKDGSIFFADEEK